MKLLSGYCLHTCSFKFSVSSNFIVSSACSCLSTSFQKSISESRIDDGCDILFFIATVRSCGVRVIIKNYDSFFIL